MLGEVIGDLLAADRGYQVIQQLPGIGPVLAAVIIAEIGDVTRFKNPRQLCSQSGLTPWHRESDVNDRPGDLAAERRAGRARRGSSLPGPVTWPIPRAAVRMARWWRLGGRDRCRRGR
jgi:transposase